MYLWNCNPPALFFLFRIVLATCDPLWFLMNFKIAFFYFCEKWDGCFDWDCKQSFSRMVIFTRCILPIHRHGMSPHFIVSFLNLFLQRFKIFHCRSSSLSWLGLFLDNFLRLLWKDCVYDLLFCIFVVDIKKIYWFV